jgi:hypothetical protein
MRIPLVLIQLIPIVVLLLPLIEAVGLTVFWRRSLSSPWLYGIVGTLVAYAVAVGAVFVAEQYKPSRGTVITSSSPVWRDDARSQNQAQAPKPAPVDNGPTFELLTPSWFALLAAVVVLCGLALWGLKFAFRTSTP